MARDPTEDGVAARAQAWRHAAHTTICDVSEPWAHGTVVRATRYPHYYDFNLVRVEEDPGMSVKELVAFADEALAGLAHRCIDFDVIAAADARRAGFRAADWRAVRLLWMRHQGPPPPDPELEVEEVHYDAAHDLRAAWLREDLADRSPPEYHAQAREVALRRDVLVLAVREGGVPVAFAHLERAAGGAEITQVYVHPEHRGAGRGTAMTAAAIRAAGDVADLWIVADDEDRPKGLYGRLGFRPAWTAMQFLRPPGPRVHPPALP